MINAGNSTAVVKEQIEDAVALAGYSAPTSWADATDKINGTADQFERDQIADGMNGGLARDRINALFGGPVWAPEGAQLTIDFAANKAWTRNSAVTDSVDAVDLTRAGSVLMLGPDGYEEFVAGELARIDGIGAQVAPARTNKCANYNANPTDLTGVTKFGDAAATLTVVDDSAELDAAGLSSICTSGMVYKLDNSAGSTDAQVFFSGDAGNLNAHSISIFLRGSGEMWFGLTGQGSGRITGPASASYTWLRSESISPNQTTRNVNVRAAAGAVIYFILNQLEEGSYASPPIITSGAAVSRPGDILSASVPDGGRAFVFEFDLLEPLVGAGVRRLLQWGGAVADGARHTLFVSAPGTLAAQSFSDAAGTSSLVSWYPTTGKPIAYGVVSDTWRRVGVVDAGEASVSTTTVTVSEINRLGVGSNAVNTQQNTFIHAHRFTERPVTDFATPADAFAWAKSIAQGWAS